MGQTPSGSLTNPTDHGDVRAAARATRAWRVFLIAVTLVLYGQNLTHSLGEFPDASHHLMNGVFVHDAWHEAQAAAAGPVSFAIEYYRHYPAVNLGYYLPVFPVLEAGMMLLFGVSGASAQLAVLTCAVLLALFSFAWFQLRFPRWWAGCAALLLVAAPYLVYWGRDIMLEVPLLAFVMGAMWFFERMLRSARPRWGESLAWVLLTTLALWTKQHALMLPVIYLAAVVATRRWRHLLMPPVIAGMFLVAAATVALMLFVLAQGGDAVGHSVGFTGAHVVERFNVDQWVYYLRRVDRIFHASVIILALCGAAWCVRGRPAGSSVLVVWLVAFYVLHSYPRAQDPRYAVLWMPPIIALAVYALRELPAALAARFAPAARPLAAFVSVGLMLATLIHTVHGATLVRLPRVPEAHLVAMQELRERLGPFTCLTFVPARDSRPAVLYRLAVEEQRQRGASIYHFGKTARANQVLRGWREHWNSVPDVDQALRGWNVKFLLVEWPSELDENFGSTHTWEVLRELIDGPFRPVWSRSVDLTAPRAPVRFEGPELRQRTLTIYERVEPMEYIPGASPPIRPKRVPMVIPAVD